MPAVPACGTARCPVTEPAFRCGARNAEDREEPAADPDALFCRAPLDDRALTRARSVRRELTAGGRHRPAGAVGLLVAATAELQGLTVLQHYDSGFETVASVTGRRTQGLMPPGSLQEVFTRRAGGRSRPSTGPGPRPRMTPRALIRQVP